MNKDANYDFRGLPEGIFPSFRNFRRLGHAITAFEQQIEEIKDVLDENMPDTYTAPEKAILRLSKRDDDLPGAMRVEVMQDKRWQGTPGRDYAQHVSRMDIGGGAHNHTFLGKSMEADADGQVWVYSEDRDVRVRFDADCEVLELFEVDDPIDPPYIRLDV